MDVQKVLEEIDDVLGFSPQTGGTLGVSSVTVRYKACVERLAPPGSPFRKMADALDPFALPGTKTDMKLRAIVEALREAVAKDRLANFEELVHAAVFDDLLIQSVDLLNSDYLLAAVVTAGAVFEEHLRCIGRKHAVDLGQAPKWRKTSQINDDLKSIGAFDQPTWRQNQVWLDLRNEAAHGSQEFKNRTKEEVRRFLGGLKEFLTRFSA